MDKLASYTVDLEPIGRRTECLSEQTILEAAQHAGVEIVAVCGGVGSCGKCRIRLIDGELSPPTAVEHRIFNEVDLDAGLRLACQAYPRSHIKIDIPPESLSTPQRLQIEGQEAEVEPNPVIESVKVALSPPTIHDLRSDTVRLTDAMAELNLPRPFYSQPVLRDLSHRLRDQDWTIKLAIRDQVSLNNTPKHTARREVVGVLKPEQPMVGLAVDIGTTKIAAYLVELESGRTLTKAGIMNPQIAYGEDVVSRIAFSNENPDGRQILQKRLIEGLNVLIGDLCKQTHLVR